MSGDAEIAPQFLTATKNTTQNIMTKIKNLLLAAGCVTALSLSSGKLAAQPRNFDPAQMKERVLTNIKDQMEVTDDAEWKVLSDAIGKVLDARMEASAGNFGGMRNMMRRRGTNDNNGDQGGQNQNQNRNRGGFGAPSAEAEDLQKAIDAKAPADEIKSKLAKLRETNAAKEAKLTAAQEDLKKLLTSRQEAVAVLDGLLK
jgi:hypothetical protein